MGPGSLEHAAVPAELALSARALALRPHVVATRPCASPGEVELELAFEPAALSEDERSELARIAEEDERGEALAAGRLRCRLGALEALRARAPCAAIFLAARENRNAPARAPRLMGVLNVTPDSFSDAGLYADPARALDRALEMVEEGARVIDVGGESTRPGAQPVPLEVELARIVPVLQALAREVRVPLSIDTTKAEVAQRALDAGASIVNDVSAARGDPAMLPLVAARKCGLVLMHMQGSPRDMQRAPRYEDVVREVLEFLRGRARASLEAGIERERLWIDPGIGFGKTLDHNLELLARLRSLRELGLPLCVGVSRKSFIAALAEQSGAAQLSGESERASAGRRAGAPSGSRLSPQDRIGGTAAAVAACVLAGSEILRVHDVRVMAEAARVAWALAQIAPSEM